MDNASSGRVCGFDDTRNSPDNSDHGSHMRSHHASGGSGGGKKTIPTYLKWHGGGKDVYVSGSFNSWKENIPMVKSQDIFYKIVHLSEGTTCEYKFLVDGQWECSPHEPKVDNNLGTQNNVTSVQPSDFEVFEALAVDSLNSGDKDAWHESISSAAFRKPSYLSSGSQLSLKGSSDVIRHPLDVTDVGHMVKWCPKYDSHRLLCLWSVTGIGHKHHTVDLAVDLVPTMKDLKFMFHKSIIVEDSSQLIQSIAIQTVERVDDLQDTVKLEVSSDVGVAIHQMPHTNVISNMCWASVPNSDEAILYTTNPCCDNRPANSNSKALLRCMDGTSYEQFHRAEFKLKDVQSCFSCSWNTIRNNFSIGTTDSVAVIDVASRQLLEYYNVDGPVFVQAFESQKGDLLYSGTQNGWIHMHDLRSNSRDSVHQLQHPSMISHIQAHNVQDYMLSSDATGKIYMWDIREWKVVTEYAGRHCPSVHPPFHMDDSNTLITAADELGDIYIWDVQSGDLLKTLPPPCPVNDKFSIPSVCYSPSWGKYSEPGLVAGVRDRVYFYG